MSKIRNSIFIALLLAFSIGSVHGQVNSEDIRPGKNSPYSRLGLGDLENNYYSAAGAMGGVTAAYNSPYNLNLANPAALAFLRQAAFEVGIDGTYGKLTSGALSDSYWGGNLKYMALGFALKNKLNQELDQKNSPWQFGTSLNLTPYSSTGYSVVLKGDSGNPELASTNTLKGTGSIYRFTWGSGARYKGLALGVNLGYQFGTLNDNNNVTFDSLSFAYYTEINNQLSISGTVLSLGAQYQYDFKKKNEKGEMVPNGRQLIVGFYGNGIQSFNTSSDHYFHRNTLYPAGTYVDTISVVENVADTGQLPISWTGGLTYKHDNFKVSFDYGQTKWSGYKNEAKNEILFDSWRFSTGLEYIPDPTSYNSYAKKIRYRAGYYTATDPRKVGNEQLKQSAVTFGFGLPIIRKRQQMSFLDVGFEIGQRGIKDALHENYYKMTLGFTLNDNSWFFKRKYN